MARDRQKQLEYNRQWRLANTDKVREYNRANYERIKAVGYERPGDYKPSREQTAEYNRRWREKNPGAGAAATRAWKQANYDEALRRARERDNAHPEKRNAKMAARRTPSVPWAKHERDAITALYATARATGMHVDHIYPIKGPNFCGLHCLANLQLLTPEENRKKRGHPPTNWPDQLWETY